MKRNLTRVAASIALLFLVAPLAGASQVTINGETHSCNGSMVFANGRMTCNGVEITTGTQDDSPCGKGVEVIAYTNPDGSKGGRMSRRVQVRAPRTITISADSLICGSLTLDGTVRIEGSRLNGPGTITGVGSKGIAIRGSVVNGQITARGDGILIEQSVVNGELLIRDAARVVGTVLNGRSELSGHASVTRSVVNGDAKLQEQAQLNGAVSGR